MKKWQTKSFVCALVALFVGMTFSGLLFTSTSTPSIVAPESNNLETKFDYGPIFTQAQYDSYDLSNVLNSADRVFLQPTEAINATIYNNSRTVHCGEFYVTHTNFPIDVTLRDMVINDSILQGIVVINASPTVTMDTVTIESYLETANNPALNLGSPTLDLTSVIVPTIRLNTGGTLDLNSCTVTNLTIAGDIIVTISADSTVTDTYETILPTVAATQTSIAVPFSFLFQPTADVTLSWTGQDNIRGPAYGLNYTLRILKNGVYDSTITDIATTSYTLPIDTAVAVYTIELTATDKQNNVSTIATIHIIPSPDLLWFILMIVIIASAAVATVFLLYWTKQRQWQKTSLMEIPT